jgi:hypothetical protein
MSAVVLLVLSFVAALSQTATPSATVVRRYAAPEAGQAVAVDATHFYAITNAKIAKYVKATGARVAEWTEAPDGPIKHLNSGLVLDGKLYAAHSNYPETPMVSSIEIFDTATLAHVGSHSFGFGHGSATWIETRNGAWWVVFANYAGKGGEPGRGPEYSTLVRYDREWREQEAWAFPSAVVARWDGMSSSGGVWGSDGLLYTSGHHSTELYVLSLPKSGAVLDLVRIVPFASEGQGIAVDRDTGLLWSIQRKTREVLVSKLP